MDFNTVINLLSLLIGYYYFIFRFIILIRPSVVFRLYERIAGLYNRIVII